jgi:hypothetical protein
MRALLLACVAAIWIQTPSRAADVVIPDPKPVPRMQALPQPYDQVSFQRDGAEIARFHFGNDLRRPFVFPVIGPSGRSLTRMGHPHDPLTHSHHNSVWISHADVNGISFWDDRAKGRIVFQRVENFADSDQEASVTTVSAWQDDKGKTLLTERRRTLVHLLPRDEWFLIIDLELETKTEPVTLGQSPFGMIGVRMAKTIGVHDGGGMIRNSEGDANETNVFWKRARWVDYSGPITSKATEGITLMDHPSNPNHPTVFHVRNDGWMGASLTQHAPRIIQPGKPLRLRYGLYVHGGKPSRRALDERWNAFRDLKLPDIAPAKK